MIDWCSVCRIFWNIWRRKKLLKIITKRHFSDASNTDTSKNFDQVNAMIMPMPCEVVCTYSLGMTGAWQGHVQHSTIERIESGGSPHWTLDMPSLQCISISNMLTRKYIQNLFSVFGIGSNTPWLGMSGWCDSPSIQRIDSPSSTFPLAFSFRSSRHLWTRDTVTAAVTLYCLLWPTATVLLLWMLAAAVGWL